MTQRMQLLALYHSGTGGEHRMRTALPPEDFESNADIGPKRFFETAYRSCP